MRAFKPELCSQWDSAVTEKRRNRESSESTATKQYRRLQVEHVVVENVRGYGMLQSEQADS